MLCQLKNAQQGVSHSSLAVNVGFVPCINTFFFLEEDANSRRCVERRYASYDLGVYIYICIYFHISLLSKALITEVSADAVSSPPVSSDLMITSTITE